MRGLEANSVSLTDILLGEGGRETRKLMGVQKRLEGSKLRSCALCTRTSAYLELSLQMELAVPSPRAAN